MKSQGLGYQRLCTEFLFWLMHFLGHPICFYIIIESNICMIIISQKNDLMSEKYALCCESEMTVCHSLLQITYARAAKQVDVRVLKLQLWNILKQQPNTPAPKDLDACEPSSESEAVDFQNVIQHLRGGDGAALNDLSVHLCFICLLHLANEHELVVEGVEDMNRLLVSNISQPTR